MIPGVTDCNRLPRLGKIRLGEKVKNQSGKDLCMIRTAGDSEHLVNSYHRRHFLPESTG